MGEEDLVDNAIPNSTKYKNKLFTVTIFLTNGNLHKVGVWSTRIEDTDALSLDYWPPVSKFVMEVTKESGERSPPKIINGVACGIQRYLKEESGAERLYPLDNCHKR